MNHFEAVLVCDGSSDYALESPIRWLLTKHGFKGKLTFNVEPTTDRPGSLQARIEKVISDFNANLLFVHRDAEREPLENRKHEIEAALSGIDILNVPIIPIRMLEAWMLFDEQAIRKAAGNPNGSAKINLPTVRDIESLPDPKSLLLNFLKDASGLTGRRRQKFKPLQKRHLVAEEITDYSPLMVTEGFKDFSDRVKEFVESTQHS